jgi:hypothetical protein
MDTTHLSCERPRLGSQHSVHARAVTEGNLMVSNLNYFERIIINRKNPARIAATLLATSGRPFVFSNMFCTNTQTTKKIPATNVAIMAIIALAGFDLRSGGNATSTTCINAPSLASSTFADSNWRANSSNNVYWYLKSRYFSMYPPADDESDPPASLFCN